MITVAEARQFVLSSCHRLAPVPANVSEAVGYVLAEPVRSSEAGAAFYQLFDGRLRRPLRRCRDAPAEAPG